MRVLELFAGIGGLALGLERAGLEAVGFVEIDEDCRHWLKEHWPGVPQWKDVKEVSADVVRGAVGSVDVVAGGFPCQPHSVAGARRGVEDERHLWPEFIRVVRELRPTWVVAENVPGIRTSAADEVIRDLEESGYAVWPTVVGACDLGAPHQRRRVFFIARVADCASATIRHVQQRLSRGQVDNAPSAGCEAGHRPSVESGSGSLGVGGSSVADSSCGRQRVRRGPRRKGNGRDVDGGGQDVAHGDGGTRRRVQGGDSAGVEGREGASGNQPPRRGDGPVGDTRDGSGGERKRTVGEVGSPSAEEGSGGDSSSSASAYSGSGMGDTLKPGREERHLPEVAGGAEGGHAAEPVHAAWPAPPGLPQWEWEEPRLAYSLRPRRRGQSQSDARGSRGEAGKEEGSESEPERASQASGGGGAGAVAHSPRHGQRGQPAAERADGERARSGGDEGVADGVGVGLRPGSASVPGQEGGAAQPGDTGEGPTGDAESALGAPVDGLPEGVVGFSTAHRRAALKAVGNAVVPQVAEAVGRAIMLLEGELRRAR